MPQPFDLAYAVALKKLRNRDCFEGEIRRVLGEFDEDVVEGVLIRLRNKGLIDDTRTALEHVERNTGKGAVGAEALRAKLISRGASEQSLSGIDWHDGEELRILDVLTAHFRHNHEELGRAGRLLMRRGFDPDMIESALERFFTQPSTD